MLNLYFLNHYYNILINNDLGHFILYTGIHYNRAWISSDITKTNNIFHIGIELTDSYSNLMFPDYDRLYFVIMKTGIGLIGRNKNDIENYKTIWIINS